MNQRINDLRNQVTVLGKEVAESQSTTQFPEWVHFKIGISTLEGVPFDNEFWLNRAKPGISNSSESTS